MITCTQDFRFCLGKVGCNIILLNITNSNFLLVFPVIINIMVKIYENVLLIIRNFKNQMIILKPEMGKGAIA